VGGKVRERKKRIWPSGPRLRSRRNDLHVFERGYRRMGTEWGGKERLRRGGTLTALNTDHVSSAEGSQRDGGKHLMLLWTKALAKGVRLRARKGPAKKGAANNKHHATTTAVKTYSARGVHLREKDEEGNACQVVGRSRQLKG